MNDTTSATSFEEVYQMFEEVGRGAYATVRRCRRKVDGSIFAVKIIRKGAVLDVEPLRKEMHLLQSIDHPSIVSLVDSLDTEEELFLVTTFARGGELFERLIDRGSYSEHDAGEIMEQLVSAVGYLHDLNVIHRDIKPENILLLDEDPSSNRVALTDFGTATMFEEQGRGKRGRGCRSVRTHSVVGTLLYMAPEVVSGRGYGRSADMWSLGIVAYTVLSGTSPFPQNDPVRMQELILAGTLEFPTTDWADVSDQAQDWIRRLVVPDPGGRMGANSAMRHEWMKESRGSPTDKVQSEDGGWGSRRRESRLSMSEEMQRSVKNRRRGTLAP